MEFATLKPMQKQFTYGEQTFDYELIQERRRTMVIEVKPDQRVVVKAPRHVAQGKIEEFIQSKVRWIQKHRENYSRIKPAAPRQYVDGEIFRYLGQDFQLMLMEATADEHVVAQYGKLLVYTRRSHSPLYIRKLIEEWYALEAERVFAERLAICAKQFGLDERPRLAVRAMKSRLGSYSTKTKRVCLNRELIKAELRFIDYVIIHELCHTRYHSHDKAFYFLLARHLPHWKELEAELERSLHGSL